MAAGDHIKVHREMKWGVTYWHHGVDLGDGRVVHRSGEPDDLMNKTDACVVVVPRTEFAEGADVVVEDAVGVDEDSAPIVQRALSQVGRVGYHLIWDNCEHFAHWCRRGRWRSKQVRHAGVRAAALGMAARAAAGAATGKVAVLGRFMGPMGVALTAAGLAAAAASRYRYRRPQPMDESVEQ
jgi:hypothetical protein